MDLAKITHGIENTRPDKKIREKWNHHDGTFLLALSKLVAATKIDAM